MRLTGALLHPPVRSVARNRVKAIRAGNDERAVNVPALPDPAKLARILTEGYLASVAGVGHSWTCVLNGVKIAEITVSDIGALVRETSYSNENRAHFVYHSASY